MRVFDSLCDFRSLPDWPLVEITSRKRRLEHLAKTHSSDQNEQKCDILKLFKIGF